MPSLDLLATFLEVWRTGSLTAAAERLGVTQPAVSGQLARLEEQVGEPLFVRSRKGVVPTARAADLAARIGGHVDGLRQAMSPVGDTPELRGTIRIGGPAELITARVIPALAALSNRSLQIHTTLGLAHDLLSALAEARLDLVVAAVRPVHKSLLATPLADEEFFLVGTPSMAQGIDRARLADDPVGALAHLPLVAYAEDLPIVRRYWRSEFGRRPANRTALVVPDLRAVLAAVIAGAGVSVLPRYLVDPALAAGSVERLHEPEVPPLNTLYLATQRGGLSNPAVAHVHDHLLQRARGWDAL
ncbi:LysR family transcriptional regulator [Streptomyces sp. NPDC020681]|uniref:LysR family transcriptional regulator n=1 Tax=Streptomyces sp. NPDC020681 TaxID=3365083 RepID=UPI0037A1A79E